MVETFGDVNFYYYLCHSQYDKDMELYNLLKEYLRGRDVDYREMPFGIAFKHDKLDYVFITDKGDEQYFRLVMPCIFDLGSGDHMTIYNAINHVNSRMKVVKAFVEDGAVNLAFEILADNTPVIADFLPRALTLLSHARAAFYTNLDGE